MFQAKGFSIAGGFLLLFCIYHFPEFFPEFWVAALFKIGFLVAAWALACFQGWPGLRCYGLGLQGPWKKRLAGGFMLGFLAYSMVILLSVFAGNEKVLFGPAITGLVGQVPFLLLFTAVPSMAEDILTRGYWYAHFSNKLKPLHWVFFSAGIYVLNHIWRLNDGLAVLAYLLVLGLLLAYTVQLTRSLWLAFGLHWGANFTFEFTRPYLQAAAENNDSGNWMLAAVWAVLLGVFLLKAQYHSRKDRSGETISLNS